MNFLMSINGISVYMTKVEPRFEFIACDIVRCMLENLFKPINYSAELVKVKFRYVLNASSDCCNCITHGK